MRHLIDQLDWCFFLDLTDVYNVRSASKRVRGHVVRSAAIAGWVRCLCARCIVEVKEHLHEARVRNGRATLLYHLTYQRWCMETARKSLTLQCTYHRITEDMRRARRLARTCLRVAAAEQHLCSWLPERIRPWFGMKVRVRYQYKLFDAVVWGLRIKTDTRTYVHLLKCDGDSPQTVTVAKERDVYYDGISAADVYDRQYAALCTLARWE